MMVLMMVLMLMPQNQNVAKQKLGNTSSEQGDCIIGCCHTGQLYTNTRTHIYIYNIYIYSSIYIYIHTNI